MTPARVSVPGAEWLEADGYGGFAMGRADGLRTRRYHALLTVARQPPSSRVTLVNAVEAWVTTPDGRFALTSHRYEPDVIHPDGIERLSGFTGEPWPTWTWRLPGGVEVQQELIVRCGAGAPLTALCWRLRAPASSVQLTVRPLISGRDLHSTHHENDSFTFDAHTAGDVVAWQPYAALPAIAALSNGRYEHEPLWFRQFDYEEERARGLDFTEDLASPGTFHFDVGVRHAILAFGVRGTQESPLLSVSASDCFAALRAAEERRRAHYAHPMHAAAAAYVVARVSPLEASDGRTIVAGYPWFSDWGRDTFIAMRGLCIAAGRLAEARAILLEWSRHLSEGMLPNYFPESGEAPRYNSVDASLWFVVAAHELLEAPSGSVLTTADRQSLRASIEEIVTAYAGGTRFGIGADDDGLLRAGIRGMALTWMDARIDQRPVTPRIGKPVEVQALWINALQAASRAAPRWSALADRARTSFHERFWNNERQCLFDVIDVDHERDVRDASVRPNQLLAAGGLPLPVLEVERARLVVDTVERALWTPAGPRTLASDDAGYAGRYEGPPARRDAAYHQGTVWPWMAGPFVSAWIRTHGGGADARAESRRRFVDPLIAHYAAHSQQGHIAELADGDAPHTPRGCPFQAWSLGELIRLGTGV
ncbi:MAG TPA: amylo-alpha-1,6-glucosidase [Gemmatimonadaceae bacterium]|nr:amylo-alpha-1,6-glucosidase [Gemmatimonadaceae bacterium]